MHWEMSGKQMNKYKFVILLGVLMFFNSCKTYTITRYYSKDELDFISGKKYKFSNEHLFNENLMFVYFNDCFEAEDNFYSVCTAFYNKTGKAPSIKISDFTVKDENGKIIFIAEEVDSDKIQLYKAEKMTDNGYYRYYFGFDRTIKAEDVTDQCYYINCTLNGIEFEDVLIRIEKKRWGPVV